MNGTLDRCGLLLMEWSSRAVASNVNVILVFRRQCRSCIQLCQHELGRRRAPAIDGPGRPVHHIPAPAATHEWTSRFAAVSWSEWSSQDPHGAGGTATISKSRAEPHWHDNRSPQLRRLSSAHWPSAQRVSRWFCSLRPAPPNRRPRPPFPRAIRPPFDGSCLRDSQRRSCPPTTRCPTRRSNWGGASSTTRV